MKKGTGVIIFIAGAIVGFVAGGLTVHIVEAKKREKENGGGDEKETEIPEEYRRVKKERIVTRPQLVDEKPPLNVLARETRDYERELAEAEHPLDDDEEDDRELEFVDEETTLIQNFDHEATKDRPPTIISIDDLGGLPERFTEVDLYYFLYDNVVTDEDDNELNVTERETLLGDTLDTNGFTDASNRLGDVEDERVVLNYALDNVYVVHRVIGSYDEFMKSKEDGSDWEPDEHWGMYGDERVPVGKDGKPIGKT